LDFPKLKNIGFMKEIIPKIIGESLGKFYNYNANPREAGEENAEEIFVSALSE